MQELHMHKTHNQGCISVGNGGVDAARQSLGSCAVSDTYRAQVEVNDVAYIIDSLVDAYFKCGQQPPEQPVWLQQREQQNRGTRCGVGRKKRGCKS